MAKRRYAGDLEAARLAIAEVTSRTDLEESTGVAAFDTQATCLALLGDAVAAREACTRGSAGTSMAAWILAAREHQWPFEAWDETWDERPGLEVPPIAWVCQLYATLEGFVKGRSYRGAGAAREGLPDGLVRALSHAWPEMAAYLGGVHEREGNGRPHRR